MAEIHAQMADVLTLAAAPTFAIMALAAAMPGASPGHMLHSAGHAALLGGMAPMYALMSAFHSPPWLRLVFGRSSGSQNHTANA